MGASPDIDALLASNTRYRPGGVCSIGIALDELAPDVRAKIEAAMDDMDSYSATGLAVVLSQLVGRRVTSTTVGRHRRRECLCR